jgi:hypothetical protein
MGIASSRYARWSRLLRRRNAPPDRNEGAPAQLDALSPEDARIVHRALPYTMTGVARLQATIDAVRYCERRGVDGSFAECGVWRGGSVLAMILTLQQLGRSDRDIYLYDTFEGMTEPTERYTSEHAPAALDTWRAAQAQGQRPWGEMFSREVFNEESVRSTLLETGYPEDRLHLVRGPVESTVPSQAPREIALLRLDTDWYESTLHELEHLYPRLATGGVLIIDDYGHWQGARRAVDEYFGGPAAPILLNRTDYTGRIGVKL